MVATLWLSSWIVGTVFLPSQALLSKSLDRCFSPPTSAFHRGVLAPRKRRGLLATSRDKHLSDSGGTSASSKGVKFTYSDDCFGLIALSTGIAAQDAVFSGTFVALSAATALAGATVCAQSLNAASHQRQVPAAVAGATLVLAPLVRWTLRSALQYEAADTMPPWAPTLEVAVCLFSLAYGFFWAHTPLASNNSER